MLVTAENLALAGRCCEDAFQRAYDRTWVFWFRTRAALRQAREEMKRADRLAEVVKRMKSVSISLEEIIVIILTILSFIPTFGIIAAILLFIFELITGHPLFLPEATPGFYPARTGLLNDELPI